MEGQNQAATQTTPVNQSSGSADQSGTQGQQSETFDLGKIFGEDFLKNPATKDFKDAGSFMKAFLDTKALVGKPRFDVPAQDTPPEIASEFWKKMGVPIDGAGYGFKKPDNFPEGMNYDEADAAAWADFFKQHNVPVSVANALRDRFFETQIKSMNSHKEQSAAQQAEADKRLDSQYEKAFGPAKLEQANRIKALLGEAITDPTMREDMMKSLPDTAMLGLAFIEKHLRTKYGNPDTNRGDGGVASGNPDSMREEAKAIMRSDAYRDGMHKDHAATVERVNAMYRSIAELTSVKK